MEAELRRVVEENRRLRGILEELTRSYGALYQQLLLVTQGQHHQHRLHPADLMISRPSLAHVSAVSSDYMADLPSVSSFSVLFPLIIVGVSSFSVFVSFNCCCLLPGLLISTLSGFQIPNSTFQLRNYY